MLAVPLNRNDPFAIATAAFTRNENECSRERARISLEDRRPRFDSWIQDSKLPLSPDDAWPFPAEVRGQARSLRSVLTFFYSPLNNGSSSGAEMDVGRSEAVSSPSPSLRGQPQRIIIRCRTRVRRMLIGGMQRGSAGGGIYRGGRRRPTSIAG